jgi:biopolymer transport protein ExbD
MGFKKRVAGENPGFQMAPMIDVIFLLLVFFMVWQVFATWENKIGIEVPTAKSADPPSRRSAGELIINLDASGSAYLNSREVSLVQLEGILTEVADSFKHHRIIIRADRKTDFEAVIRVMDICRNVDIKDIAFATIDASEATDAP